MLPRNYAPDYAPFTLDSDGHLLKIPVSLKVAKVWVSFLYRWMEQVEVSQILEIDEVGQVLANQFTLYMTW